MRWWRWKDREQDLEREIRSDLELEAEEQQANGLSPDGARYAAQRAFGNAALVKEEVRETWGFTSLERLCQDLRYAVRVLRNAPAFTAVAVLSITLGIAANTTVFSLIDAMWFRTLPVRDPGQLVRVYGWGLPKGARRPGIDGFSWPLLSYSVVRRTREFGIRIAIGAKAGSILSFVIGEALRLLVAGTAICTVAAWFLGRVVKNMLLGIKPADPLSAVVAVLILVTAALVAAWIPARRASRVDPIVALKYD